jgi:dTDP-4-dehydrorhamnose 3,5-epimerase-like enzyme
MVILTPDFSSLYIPKCFAHAYLALDNSTILFKTTTYYRPNDEYSFSFLSPEFDDIPWADIDIYAKNLQPFSEETFNEYCLHMRQ